MQVSTHVCKAYTKVFSYKILVQIALHMENSKFQESIKKLMTTHKQLIDLTKKLMSVPVALSFIEQFTFYNVFNKKNVFKNKPFDILNNKFE